MAKFHKVEASALMIDGSEYGPVRIIHVDKVRWERAARVNEWSIEDNSMTFNAFITWAALERSGEIKMSYDEFITNLETAETEEVSDENPTS